MLYVIIMKGSATNTLIKKNNMNKKIIALSVAALGIIPMMVGIYMKLTML